MSIDRKLWGPFCREVVGSSQLVHVGEYDGGTFPFLLVLLYDSVFLWCYVMCRECVSDSE